GQAQWQILKRLHTLHSTRPRRLFIKIDIFEKRVGAKPSKLMRRKYPHVGRAGTVADFEALAHASFDQAEAAFY
ncbi:hypothetical protein, partial [Hymenobacter lapidarius]|uniref:hypothetical protein n=1 Tax=Hymenobacter lapidarius TaxID=1908237 RepID=UPI001957EBAD